MKKFITILVLFSSSSAMAQGLYSNLSSSGGNRHSLIVGQQFHPVLSFELAYNQFDGNTSGRTDYWLDADTSVRHRYKAGDASNIMIWQKFQYDMNPELTSYWKFGIGRFEIDIDNYNEDGKKINRRTHVESGAGFAMGVDYSLTKKLYTSVEYQYFHVKNIGPIDHSRGGFTLGMGYKF